MGFNKNSKGGPFDSDVIMIFYLKKMISKLKTFNNLGFINLKI